MSGLKLPFHIRAMKYGAFHLRKFKQSCVDYLLASQRRKKLVNDNFSVICDTCFAGMGIYGKFGLKYTTPTVGLYFPANDYIFFLEHFEELIKKPLYFTAISKDGQRKPYPVGLLDGKVEVRFVHYKSENEAAMKWGRRCARVNFDNLFFIFSDREGFNCQLLDRYARLPFKNKIYLSATDCKKYPGLVVYIKEFAKSGHVDERIKVNRVYEKHFDVLAWLNGQPNYLLPKHSSEP